MGAGRNRLEKGQEVGRCAMIEETDFPGNIPRQEINDGRGVRARSRDGALNRKDRD
jgi:hypothetical protein